VIAVYDVDCYALTVSPSGQTVTDIIVLLTINIGASSTIRVYIDEKWKSVSFGTTIGITIQGMGGTYLKSIEFV